MPRVIITVSEKNPQPYRFQLDRMVVSLGRGSENDIVIESGSVSAKHAEMRRVEGGYELADIGSTNGLKSDGVRKEVIRLLSGMTVKLGDVAFEFSLSEEELATLNLERPTVESPILREAELPPVRKAAMDLPPAYVPPRSPTFTVEPTPAGGGFWMIFFFLILAAAAFFTGLSIRHQKETGGPLWKAMATKEDAAKPAPAAEKMAPTK